MSRNKDKAPNPSPTPTPTPPWGVKVLGYTLSPLDYLLVALPLALILKVAGASPLWIFLVSCVAIIPLAGLMGRATENLAETLGSGIGGLLNATFGNAAELIIALIALNHARTAADPKPFLELVKASITGSILGNILLVLGLAVLLGGIYHRKQNFNRTAASMGATLLALAAAALLIPTLFFEIARASVADPTRQVETLSEEIAFVLIIVYGFSLWFTLKTHRDLFTGEEEKPADGHAHQPEWSRKTSLLVLLGATVGVAIVSELLVGSVEVAAHKLHMPEVFVGVIVVAVIGNAAEHSTAVLVAMKNKMDLAVNIAIGSSIQIALFVAPVLVFASLAMGLNPILDLHFTWMEVVAVVISILVLGMVCQDGETHWMEGVMLLAVYVVLGLAFFNLK